MNSILQAVAKHAREQYLAETYYHVKHTIGLMHLAGEMLAFDKVWLREALGRYIAGKTEHEEWILDDIAQVGGDAELVRHGTPRFATEVMVARLQSSAWRRRCTYSTPTFSAAFRN
jgi:hypothetical protein